MKILNFSNGGRPLLNDDLVALQDNDELRAEAWLRGLGAGAFVLEGCELTNVSGNTFNLSAGVVFANGKIAEIEAVNGLDLSTPQFIIINQDSADDTRLYEDGQSEIAGFTRIASVVGNVPIGFEGIQLNNSSQPINLRKVLDNASVPVGTILDTDSVASFNVSTGLGSGSWANWALCDGRNGTPDLRGRFVVGYDPAVTDYNATGKTGGLSSVTLTIAQMPAHRHKLAEDLISNNPIGFSTSLAREYNAGAGDLKYRLGSGGVNAVPTLGNSGNSGEGQSHENRPPYFVLAKVKKIG